MKEFNLALADILEVDEVRPSDILTDFVEWDSLSVLSAIVMIQRKYGATLSAFDLKGVETAQGLYELVTRKSAILVK